METSYGFPKDIPASATAVCIALHERDSSTHQHCDRVSALCLELGRACGLSRHDLRRLWLAAAFHDVGKIGIPDRILRKTTALTEREWTVMRLSLIHI